VDVARRLVDWWGMIFETDKPVEARVKNQEDKIREEVARIWYDRAYAYGNFREQADALLHLNERMPRNPQLIGSLGSLYLENDRIDELRGLLASEIEKYPALPVLRYWLARAELAAGNLRDAKRQALVFGQVAPSSDELGYLLFQIERVAQNEEKAREYARTYIEKGKKKEWKEQARKYMQESASSSQQPGTMGQ